jgi:hypothetical protein
MIKQHLVSKAVHYMYTTMWFTSPSFVHFTFFLSSRREFGEDFRPGLIERKHKEERAQATVQLPFSSRRLAHLTPSPRLAAQ